MGVLNLRSVRHGSALGDGHLIFDDIAFELSGYRQIECFALPIFEKAVTVMKNKPTLCLCLLLILAILLTFRVNL